MPTLDNHHSGQYTKLIYIGDSGTGKTGSLVSLLADGYKLRVLDMDNGLDALVQHARQQQCDLSKVGYMTIRDEYKSSPMGPIVKGAPKAFINALKAMDKWEDDTIPAEWGEDTVFVLDSGSAFGRAAYEWAKGMNPTAKDPRQWYFQAQQAFESTIAMLTGESFRANVIFISHINYKELQNGMTKGYANAIGSALGPTIAKYFNTMIMAETSGSGSNVRRKIKTVPSGIVDLKTPMPFRLEGELPLESGLSTIFKMLKENGDN